MIDSIIQEIYEILPKASDTYKNMVRKIISLNLANIKIKEYIVMPMYIGCYLCIVNENTFFIFKIATNNKINYTTTKIKHLDINFSSDSVDKINIKVLDTSSNKHLLCFRYSIEGDYIIQFFSKLSCAMF